MCVGVEGGCGFGWVVGCIRVSPYTFLLTCLTYSHRHTYDPPLGVPDPVHDADGGAPRGRGGGAAGVGRQDGGCICIHGLIVAGVSFGLFVWMLVDQ